VKTTGDRAESARLLEAQLFGRLKTATANPRTRTAATPTARAGGRRDQLLALVVDRPGITVAGAR
jgi:hypothetical protein